MLERGVISDILRTHREIEFQNIPINFSLIQLTGTKELNLGELDTIAAVRPTVH